jgi:hypothetical protein
MAVLILTHLIVFHVVGSRDIYIFASLVLK